MMSIQKIKRVKLKINPIDEFILVGIVSAEPDYKLSLTLNKKFGISLKNISPIKITDNAGSELTFSRFSDTSGSPEIAFSLISNRSGNNFLLKKLKNVDYILQVHNPEKENNINRITTGLKEIESVYAVFNIEINTIKDKNFHLIQ